uniref:CUB domain-containing protein n=1 Tax=Daphnia galeata TaxID=27404 RepID=A0A8J2WDS1_9CRUS|nr:unnamed protein product [Daphnia galeata]
MIPKKMTTDFQLCLDSEATSASGTIQPLDRYTGKPRVCPFTINAPPENLIIFSCSVVNLTSDSSSFKIEGTAEMINRPIANTIYVSTGNQVKISSTLTACQDRRTNATDGIIQPVKGLVNGPRMCLFTITVPSGQRVQMSCTDVNLNGMTSSLEFAEEQNNVAAHEPMVNTIYTSKSNRIFITAVVNATDWFSCQWTSI